MTENEAASAEVLIWTASPMIIPQPPPPLLLYKHDSWRLPAQRRRAHSWFRAVALLCEAVVSTGEGEGDSRQLVQLFICLSRAYRRSLIISATGAHGRMGGYYLWIINPVLTSKHEELRALWKVEPLASGLPQYLESDSRSLLIVTHTMWVNQEVSSPNSFAINNPSSGLAWAVGWIQ